MLLSSLLANCMPQWAEADSEPTALTGSPIIYLAAGVMAVNAGATIANGAALVAGKPNRQNGMFGLVLGSATVAAAGVGLAAADGDDNSERFSIVLAGCGLASVLTGYLNIKLAGDSSSKAEQIRGSVARVMIGRRGADRDAGWLFAVGVDF